MVRWLLLFTLFGAVVTEESFAVQGPAHDPVELRIAKPLESSRRVRLPLIEGVS